MLARWRLVSRYFMLAEGAVLFYSLIYQDHTISATNYQAMFQAGESLFIILMVFIVGCGTCCFKIYQKQGRIFVISTISILSLSYFYTLMKAGQSCSNWMQGVGGVKIEQTGGYCKVVEP